MHLEHDSNSPRRTIEGKINRILREPNTTTGQHCIRKGPFADCDKISPRNQTARPSTSSKHLHQASPFAAAKEKSSSPNVYPTIYW